MEQREHEAILRYETILQRLSDAIVPPPESEATPPEEEELLDWCEALSKMRKKIPEETHMAVTGTLQALAVECESSSVRRAINDTIASLEY
ncbi:MAG: hypothetical protein V1848_03635 [Candidatus Magasanikbacteria bacterium]